MLFYGDWLSLRLNPQEGIFERFILNTYDEYVVIYQQVILSVAIGLIVGVVLQTVYFYLEQKANNNK